jgi:rhamnosyltransferase
MKLAGIVILYDPPENVFCNIATYIDDVEILFIFDNSPVYNNCIPAKYTEKVVYTHTGVNEGIAKCLNQALNFSKEAGIEYLLTMDQDSSFNEGDMDQYLKLLNQEVNSETISMFGIRYYPIKKSEKEETVYNHLLITSGSIINVNAALKIGGFDENLFIDGVDTEFCLKSYRNGFRSVCYNQICLKHLLGEEKKVLTPLLKNKYRKFHNPTRLYYIVRNHLYLRNKYPELRSYLKNKIIINEIKNCLLYAGNTLKYLSAILMAFSHNKKRTFGKLNHKHGF